MRPLRNLIVIATIAVAFTTLNCTQVYYDAWEALGKEKRDLLKDNVEGLRKDQEKVDEQFQDALTRLRELYGSDGSQLEKAYDRLKSDQQSAESRAKALRSRIERVEKIADDLFAEWETEIGTMSNPRYKDDSRQKLAQTKSRFAALKTSMRQAEKSLDPVLRTLADQVTYLKHNLNAQALGTLKGESKAIERDIERLIQDVRKSMTASDAFLATLKGQASA